MRVTRQVRSLMVPTDPAGPQVNWERAERDMQRILDLPRPADPRHRPRTRVRRRVLLLSPLMAGAVLAAVAVVDAGTDARPAPVLTVETGTTADAVRLLDRISYAAASKPALAVRDDQYVYLESKITFIGASGGEDGSGTRMTWRMDPLHTRRVWLSVDGKQSGLLEEDRHQSLWEEIFDDGETTLDPIAAPGLNAPTYRYLESLPTEPDALLRKIYAEARGMGNSPDQQAFTTIGDLLRESLIPSNLGAALYRAAAKIPGVVLVPEAADAAGRHGVAVARLDTHSGQRTEWIFDERTLEFLGERSVQVKHVPDGPEPGTLMGSTAVMTRAIVDHPGEQPTS
ncbi:CU044_5270 family protein [Streptomyces sp. NPDC051917]|uniref:CU044_5270 family protein n=1 Tax=Streptomyces sp. NPDC051917 TaxID=3154754 RepID=UPI003456A316